MPTPRSSAKRSALAIAEEVTPRRSARTQPNQSSAYRPSKRSGSDTRPKRPKAAIGSKRKGSAKGVLMSGAKVQASTGRKDVGTPTEDEEEEEPTGNIVAVASPVRRPRSTSRYGEPYILIPKTTPTRRLPRPVSEADESTSLNRSPPRFGRTRGGPSGAATRAGMPLPPAGAIMRTKPPRLPVPAIPPAGGSSRQQRTRPSLPANLPSPSSTSGRRKRKASILPSGSAESRSAVERALSGSSRSLRSSARTTEV